MSSQMRTARGTKKPVYYDIRNLAGEKKHSLPGPSSGQGCQAAAAPSNEKVFSVQTAAQADVDLIPLPPALPLLHVKTEACHSAHIIASYEKAERLGDH